MMLAKSEPEFSPRITQMVADGRTEMSAGLLSVPIRVICG